jgi:hypothetical protein
MHLHGSTLGGLTWSGLKFVAADSVPSPNGALRSKGTYHKTPVENIKRHSRLEEGAPRPKVATSFAAQNRLAM